MLRFWAGLGAILLLAAPARAQAPACEDCVAFPQPRAYADDLSPDDSIFGPDIPGLLQDRFVLSQIDRELPGEFLARMVAIAVDDTREANDFAVVVDSRAIRAVRLAPSDWYRELFDHWGLENRPNDLEGWHRAAEQMSLDKYADTRPDPADGPLVSGQKEWMNARLANRKTATCKVEIEQALAQRIGNAMRLTTIRAHNIGYSERIWVEADAKEEFEGYPFVFHFSADSHTGRADGGFLEGTRPALMVQTALAMRDYCWTHDRKYLAALNRAVDGLEKKLPKEKSDVK